MQRGAPHEFEVERARDRCMLSGAPLGTHPARAHRPRDPRDVQAACASSTRSTRVGGDVFRRRPVLKALDWPMLVLARMQRPRLLIPLEGRGTRPALHDPRRVLPAEGGARAARASTTRFLFLPRRAPARDHRAVRVLPRSRRRRRRVRRDARSRATKLAWWRAEVGEPVRGQPAASGHAGAAARSPGNSRSRRST